MSNIIIINNLIYNMHRLKNRLKMYRQRQHNNQFELQHFIPHFSPHHMENALGYNNGYPLSLSLPSLLLFIGQCFWLWNSHQTKRYGLFSLQ